MTSNDEMITDKRSVITDNASLITDNDEERKRFDEWFKPRKIAMQKREIPTIRIIRLYKRQWEAWQAALKSKQGEVNGK